MLARWELVVVAALDFYDGAVGGKVLDGARKCPVVPILALG